MKRSTLVGAGLLVAVGLGVLALRLRRGQSAAGFFTKGLDPAAGEG